MNIVIKNIKGSNDEYLLREKENTILRVMHRKDLNTARVETTIGQRVLIIENGGLIKTRVVIKNEYGVEIGQMVFDNWSDKQGEIQIENIRYKFLVNNNSTPELFIYKGAGKVLVYQCSLSFDSNVHSPLKGRLSAIIVSISWALHLKTIGAREEVPA